MKQVQTTIEVRTRGHGLTEISRHVESAIAGAKINLGLCHVFVQHTSASLIIQENADPSARRDIETFFDSLVPENDPAYTHTTEGSDDMPAHLRTTLTSTSELLPVAGGRLRLGLWQGLYLFEHRRSPHVRRLVLHIWGE